MNKMTYVMTGMGWVPQKEVEVKHIHTRLGCVSEGSVLNEEDIKLIRIALGNRSMQYEWDSDKCENLIDKLSGCKQMVITEKKNEG